MESRPPTSTLCHLPDEILAMILSYLDPADLAKLAFVNSDCRQLARSKQFSSVIFDYSEQCWSLISYLALEARLRSMNKNGLTAKPSLGACIRHIITNPHTKFYYQIPWENWGFISEEERVVERDQAEEAQRVSNDFYKPLVLGIITYEKTCPNLECLYWDGIDIPCYTFQSLALSKVKHLKLETCVDRVFEIKQPWPLRTLDLNISWFDFDPPPGSGTTKLCASILRSCASTLEEFSWECRMTGNEPQSFGIDPSDIPHFPKLKALQLSNREITFADTFMMEALLGAPLVVLEADPEHTDIHREVFARRGRIPTLETFVWKAFQFKKTTSLDFFCANNQLKKIALKWRSDASFIDTQVCSSSYIPQHIPCDHAPYFVGTVSTP